MDASDIIRKREAIAVFNGYKEIQTIAQPTINISTCCGFYGVSTIRKFVDYQQYNDVVQGLKNCGLPCE